MSIDLDWLKLDASLAHRLVDILNRQLDAAAAERPSFIGPVEVTGLDFGSNAPDVELVDLRDIYRDFLEDEDEDDAVNGTVKVTEGGVHRSSATTTDEDEEYEWVSRRAGIGTGARAGLGSSYGRRHGSSGDYFNATAIPDPWSSGLSRPPSFADYTVHAAPYPASNGIDIPVYRSPSPSTPFVHSSPLRHQRSPNNSSSALPQSSQPTQPEPPSQQPQPGPEENPHPNLQLHLHINWHSNLRISLQTSLLINYPSPMFMSLPIRLAVTGLVFVGELAVAYEGQRKRVHLCILDDMDPYGPLGVRGPRQRLDGENPDSSLHSINNEEKRTSMSTPPELDDSVIMGAAGLGISGGIGGSISSTFTQSTVTANANTARASGHIPTYRHTKPLLPIGQRLLPSIFIESEIGQTDKHVLKNVTRVERFIQDVIRKTVEEELVFPNFHTLIMGDG